MNNVISIKSFKEERMDFIDRDEEEIDWMEWIISGAIAVVVFGGSVALTIWLMGIS